MKKRRIVLDIETNSDASKIWCVVTRDLDTGEVRLFDNKYEKDKDALAHYVSTSSLIVMHNGIFFDAPILRKKWAIHIKRSQAVDTLVMSRLYSPSLDGGHSLESWGERLGHYKAPYKQIWSWMTGVFLDKDTANLPFDEPVIPLLHHYCIRDTLVTAELYKHLEREMKNDYSQKSIELEHQVAIIIAEQERNGFKLDERGATELLCTLKTKLEAIKVEMESIFPPKVESNRVHKTTGKALNDIITPFNPGSRQQIAERLQEKGWKPKKHTEKGAVIVDETTLEGIDIPEAKAIAEYLMLQKRIAQIESWLSAVESDGRVHGRVITNGAVTGRMTHMSPNMAQVPNSGAVYGPECRNLWTVEKGNRLVGIDASGLELRMLAHYMDDDAYTNEVVSGDIHTANQVAAGLETRNQAKTFIYAFLYGAGNSKIGSIVGGSAKKGEQLIRDFLKNTPKLKALREKVIRLMGQEGCLPGLDGRKLLCRSEHSALNTLLQGAGAIVMKQALVIFKKELQRQKIWHEFKVNVHDEWQIECREQDAERVGQLGKQSIANVVKELEILDDDPPNPKKRLRCPLDGEYKVGITWKDTH
jgi:DNA polymerase I-like protein with 3'-5' exonuclease and polymerase domains